MIIDNFEHRQFAHCESGVTVNLLKHYGIELSEPMVFGIGAGMFFGHLPFVKVNGVPGTTFRIWPGYIFKRVCNRLDVKIKVDRFKNPASAMQALDELLAQKKPVGMMASVYYLDYLPPAFRFHFNAHNLIAFGKEGNKYLISDPVMENVARISPDDLAKARFAKGFPEPSGRMYYPLHAPVKVDLTKAVWKGINQTCFFMLTPPVPYFGVKGIKFLGKKIKQYPAKLEPRKAALYVGNIIRMQEEIGTGGAGFRFLYAAFLQEVGNKSGNEKLLRLSEEMTGIGDSWRNFAFNAARVCKARSGELHSFDELGDMLIEISQKEKHFFDKLKKAAKK